MIIKVFFFAVLLLLNSLSSGQDLLQLQPELEAEEDRRVAIIKKAVQANVCVFSADGAGGGSGVLIDPSGLALSNFHVVDPCGAHMLCGLADGTIYDAIIVGMDPVGDLALIQLLGRSDFPTATMGNSDKVRVGQSCFAAGNPFLLANDFSPSVSWGVVSGTNRYQYPAGTLLEYADCLQTDAAINPGNSGGALFDANGNLIGINGRGSFEKRGRVNVGVGYSISINQVKRFLGSLKSGRILDHASPGFVVATGSDNSVRVSKISAESDAYRQGLRYDSKILSIAGRKTGTVNDVKNIIGTIPPHWSVPIGFQQDDVERIVMVRLTAFHSPQELYRKISHRVNPANSKKNRPTSVPERVNKWYRSRQGYANYYFQQQQLDRILKGLKRTYNPAKTATPKIKWTGASKLDDITFVMNENRSGIRIGNETGTVDGSLPFENQTSPLRSGGFLNALHLFNELLFGPSDNLAVTFHGTAPFISPLNSNRFKDWDENAQLDLLRVLRDGIEARVFVDDKFRVVAIEYFSFPNAEPCVVEFEGLFAKTPGSPLTPKNILASHQGKPFVEFQISDAVFGPFRSSPANQLGKGGGKE